MSECNGSVMRIAFFDQLMTIESSHLRNREDTDATEGTGSNRKYLTVCHISTQFSIRGALQTEECDISRYDISFQCSLCYFFRQGSCHDQLIFHRAGSQFSGCGIATVESHERIFECIVVFSFDFAFVHVCRYGVVDIQQGYRIVTYHRSNEFAQCTVDIHFTGYRNTSSGQTAVDIARNKAELCLECRPAFSCDGNIFSGTFMGFDPVKKSQLVLCQFRKNGRFVVSITQFLFHICNNCRDSLVSVMFVECFEQIQFGVFFDLHTQVEQLFDRCVTCHKILRTRTEGNDFQVFQSDNGSCNRNKFFDHLSYFFRCSYRIFRDVCFQVTKLQVIACIQHTAVGVSTSLYQIISVFFCCCNYHTRPVKIFYQQSLCSLRTEVSKIDNQGITSCFLYLFQRFLHIQLALYYSWTFVQFPFISRCHCFSSGLGQCDREAISAYCHDT